MLLIAIGKSGNPRFVLAKAVDDLLFIEELIDGEEISEMPIAYYIENPRYERYVTVVYYNKIIVAKTTNFAQCKLRFKTVYETDGTLSVKYSTEKNAYIYCDGELLGKLSYGKIDANAPIPTLYEPCNALYHDCEKEFIYDGGEITLLEYGHKGLIKLSTPLCINTGEFLEFGDELFCHYQPQIKRAL